MLNIKHLMRNIKHFGHKLMPIQFSDMLDFFSNSILSSIPPFYTTIIIQLSRCPYLQLIPRSMILLFLNFIENSLNLQKLAQTAYDDRIC